MSEMDKEVEAFLDEWESEMGDEMGDQLEVEFNKLYKTEIESTFDGTSEETGSDYTGYRLTEDSPMCPNGVFFLSGISRKSMNEYLQYNWRDPTTPIKLKWVKVKVEKPGKQAYHVVKPMVVDKW